MTPHHPSMSDEALSAAVAEHCAGLTPYRFVFEYDGMKEDCCCWRRDGKTIGDGSCPPYATSADAVLPLLSKSKEGWGCDYDGVNYYVTICNSCADADCGVAPTFARAAAFALLRAAGQKVEES